MTENKEKKSGGLLSAKVACYADVDVIHKGKQGQEGKGVYLYAPLEVVESYLRPILAKHDLGVVQVPVTRLLEDGTFLAGARTQLIHGPSGESEEYEILFPAAGDRVKQVGAIFTYAKRYSYPFALPAGDMDIDDATEEPHYHNSRQPARVKSAPGDTRITEGKLKRLHAIVGEVTGGDRDQAAELGSQLLRRFNVSSSADIDYRKYDEVIEWIQGWPHMDGGA